MKFAGIAIAAKFYGCAKSTVRRRAKRGLIKRKKVGKIYEFELRENLRFKDIDVSVKVLPSENSKRLSEWKSKNDYINMPNRIDNLVEVYKSPQILGMIQPNAFYLGDCKELAGSCPATEFTILDIVPRSSVDTGLDYEKIGDDRKSMSVDDQLKNANLYHNAALSFIAAQVNTQMIKKALEMYLTNLKPEPKPDTSLINLLMYSSFASIAISTFLYYF